MVYSVGKWREVLLEFCSSTLDTPNDPEYLGALESFQRHPCSSGLMPHQVQGGAFLSSRKGAILADDMGLGKTRSTLAALRYLGEEAGKTLIVTPAGLRRAWLDEARRYWPEVNIILADGGDDLSGDFSIAVVSYTKLKSFVTSPHMEAIKTIVVDEAHSFKNARALYGEQRRAYVERLVEGKDPGVHRTALLFSLTEHANRVYCLTGTPIMSRPRELFNLLKMTRHPLGKNFIQFSTRYCGGYSGRFGWVSDGCTHPEELRTKLQNHVLRRHKKDVLRLPPKEITRVETPLDMAGQFRYSGAWDEYVEMVKATRTSGEVAKVWQAKHLVQISLLRQICSESKVARAIERVKSHSGKVVIFSTYTRTLSLLRDGLLGDGIRALVYDGSLNEKQRAEAVESFQSDGSVSVFLAQTEAAKVGLTLTAATLVIFMDLVYTPADHFQAEDRCYRIGQSSPVRIEYFHCPGTVEDHLAEIHDTKKRIIAKIFDEDLSDGEDIITADIRKELVVAMKKKALRPRPLPKQVELKI
jgi:SWI/SNF-related matrix-associated actin-dependent regulator 1 of chromatin subfamily A